MAPLKKRNEKLTYNGTILNGRFSVLRPFRSRFKLKIFKCSYHYDSELFVHKGWMIEVAVPINCFIIF